MSMINSLCGSMGSIKSENSCESLVEPKKIAPPSCDMEQNSLTPPSLNFPAVKFELDVRNLPSPQVSSYNFNNVMSMQGQSILGCSPPRFSPQLGSYSSSSGNKGKGQSPLHRVFNSPNDQFMQVESLSLPAIEEFLDDGYEDQYQTTKISGIGTPNNMFEMPTTGPSMLDCISMPNSSTFCGSASETTSSQLDQEQHYQLNSVSRAPLSQQLQQEKQQEKQISAAAAEQQQHQNLGHTLMVPIPIGPEQEQDSGLQLVHLLLACAEAVASCFTEALSARLAATMTTSPSTSSSPKPYSPFPSNSLEVLKIYQIVYQACPYIKFAHFTANQAIFEAFETEERVHVIDLDILQGYQWPAFMQALAARPSGAPF
ncbi:hypothetical protein CXB51_021923 [Gossypium anomalum]|uniref:Uncharacterized protein n=1 Tax=Gossypium anomalum TaxID=47600 RepID=A0A8J5Z784_9ROSI|nr:hypothetical protein CXB51_021923 [Gossypium anomalum]